MTEGRVYEIYIYPAAQGDLDKLRENIHSRIISRLRSLEEEPRPRGCKKLTGAPDVYRIRVGDYRILYRIIDRDNVVNILRVPHRSQAYRK